MNRQMNRPAALKAPTFKLPFAVAADLRRLSTRLGETPSMVAERLLAAYLDVLDSTLPSGGMGAWLDRLFEAEHDHGARERLRLDLPAYQLMALRAYAAIEAASPDVILAAMIGRTLTAALAETEQAADRPAFVRTLGDLLAEHRPAA